MTQSEPENRTTNSVPVLPRRPYRIYSGVHKVLAPELADRVVVGMGPRAQVADRVWWQYRLCSYDEQWGEGSPEARRTLLAESLSKISGIAPEILVDSIPEQRGTEPDLGCLGAINQSLRNQERHFHMFRFPPREDSVLEPVYVLFLRPGELEKLKAGRGWLF